MGFVLSAADVERLKPKDYVVWHDNWPSLELFAACATQWRPLPMGGGVTGLDYTAVRAVMQMTGVQDQHPMFEDIRLLELGALAGFRKQPLEDLIDGR